MGSGDDDTRLVADMLLGDEDCALSVVTVFVAVLVVVVMAAAAVVAAMVMVVAVVVSWMTDHGRGRVGK